MDKLLVFSNNAASLTESNGRIHSYFVEDYIKKESLYNFYIRGTNDIPKVHYILISPKEALFSKITFGIYKPKVNTQSIKNVVVEPKNSKSKKPFYHLLRSFAYIHNLKIYRILDNIIKNNHIRKIMIWGTNVPYLYYYAYKLSVKNNIELITFTGEDYPLKDYNYMTKHKSLLYVSLQHSLRKWATKAYKYSSRNIYAHEDLKNLYESKMGVNKGEVQLFQSRCKRIKAQKTKNITRILYGGNLYIERVKSIIDIAKYLECFKNVYIDIYGNANKEVVDMIYKHKNLHFKGYLPYNLLLKEIESSDMLLHVEGFDPYYIKDCRYAFSTKISDYLAYGIPFFTYGPKEISGIKYLYKMKPEFVAINYHELSKLGALLLKLK